MRTEFEWLNSALSGLEDTPATERLASQLAFLMELDRAKTVLRRTYITDGSRRENDAEHMWHATLAALILAEHASEPVDPVHLALMLAVHDIVEIDAGDTFVYDDPAGKIEKETAAADRIFGLLPEDQAGLFRQMWDEFEARETPEARMAASIDRLLPLLMNRSVGGRTWVENSIPAERVFEVNSRIGMGSATLWALAQRVLQGAVESGLLSGSLPE